VQGLASTLSPHVASELQQAHVEACGCSPEGLHRVMARGGAARCTGCGSGSGAAGWVYAMPTGDAKPRTEGSEYRCASGAKEWAHHGEDCLSGAHQCAIAWMPPKPTLVPARGRLADIQAQDIRRCPWGRGGSLGLQFVNFNRVFIYQENYFYIPIYVLFFGGSAQFGLIFLLVKILV